ncbi:hypothetical protein GCM10009834_46940 [Streptomonospora arabica]
MEQRLGAVDRRTADVPGEHDADEAAEEAPANYSRRQIIEILVGLMLAMLTSMLTTSIVGTALPTIVG